MTDDEMFLDAAWTRAEASLPEFYYIRSLMVSHPYTSPVWEVVAADQRHIIKAQGATPALALIALAALAAPLPKEMP